MFWQWSSGTPHTFKSNIYSTGWTVNGFIVFFKGLERLNIAIAIATKPYAKDAVDRPNSTWWQRCSVWRALQPQKRRKGGGEGSYHRHHDQAIATRINHL